MPSDVSEVLKPTLDKFSKMTEKIGVDDFILVKKLGRGTFGKVMLVQKKDNKKQTTSSILNPIMGRRRKEIIKKNFK